MGIDEKHIPQPFFPGWKFQQIQGIAKNLVLHGLEGNAAFRIAEAISNNHFQTDLILVKNIHLVPFNMVWAVIVSDGSEVLFQEQEYFQALTEARVIAKKGKVKLIIHSADGCIRDQESFQVNRPIKQSEVLVSSRN